MFYKNTIDLIGLSYGKWLLLAGIILVWVIGYIVKRLLFHFLRARFEKKKLPGKYVIDALSTPLTIWIFFNLFASVVGFFDFVYFDGYYAKAMSKWYKVAQFIVFMIFPLTINKYFWIYLKHTTMRGANSSLVQAISRLLALLIVFFSANIILEMMGYSITSMFAVVGGSLGLLAIALKDILSVFTKDILFSYSTTIKVGDRISFNDAKRGVVSGEVLSVKWRVTCLKGDDGGVEQIPNSLLLESVINVHAPQPISDSKKI